MTELSDVLTEICTRGQLGHAVRQLVHLGFFFQMPYFQVALLVNSMSSRPEKSTSSHCFLSESWENVKEEKMQIFFLIFLKFDQTRKGKSSLPSTPFSTCFRERKHFCSLEGSAKEA